MRSLIGPAGVLAAGLLFGLGATVGGMTQPARILGFLDFFGAWDPTLVLVILGALAGYRLMLRIALGRGQPLLGGTFQIPTRRDVDLPLVAGGAVFGLGWGLAGYCPGPAFTALASGQTAPLVFVVATFTGILLFDRRHTLRTLLGRPRAGSGRPAGAGGAPSA